MEWRGGLEGGKVNLGPRLDKLQPLNLNILWEKSVTSIMTLSFTKLEISTVSSCLLLIDKVLLKMAALDFIIQLAASIQSVSLSGCRRWHLQHCSTAKTYTRLENHSFTIFTFVCTFYMLMGKVINNFTRFPLRDPLFPSVILCTSLAPARYRSRSIHGGKRTGGLSLQCKLSARVSSFKDLLFVPVSTYRQVVL